ncbi:MAG: endolytic transglycosylase MltG [Anaerolineae bacterium]|jgi:UPF0755 protein|nr:endolytic transglycosylase MltG [Anaerolineae bacterium]MBT7073364.1 endolytic transglycosylase MltG [Anaerolineae bacterium]MBT7781659.1 endolytic transglycosylase MltG [Anaerolineae bacterium]
MRRFLLFIILLLIISCLAVLITIPALATQYYGKASPALNITQHFQYAAKILWHNSVISQAANPYGIEQNFEIINGETPYQIAERLENQELIVDSEAFITLLVYTGMDTNLMPGTYKLSPSLSMQSIAGILQDTRASQILFVVLPGWRAEEIAASLPSSGLFIAEEVFLRAVESAPPQIVDADNAMSSEGFLFPGSYLISRDLTANELITELTLNFASNLTPEIKAGFAAQGLTVYDGVKLASIVEREAVVAEERTMIASVFLNRLQAGQMLQSDPTVQYALGYDSVNQIWWKNPLTYADLEIDSPYNAYIYAGLPPTPISNPSLESLEAVAFPDITPYYYFRARCDGSGLHAFAETYEGHLANGCE